MTMIFLSFSLVIGIMYFIITLILMTQVYGFFAVIFIIPFTIHIGYIVYKDELNQENVKKSFHVDNCELWYKLLNYTNCIVWQN